MQEIGKTLLGVVLGMMLGVVLYQSSRVNAGLSDTLNAQVFSETTASVLACRGTPQECNGTCCIAGEECSADLACIGITSDPNACANPADTWCQNSVSGGGMCCPATDACDPNTGSCIPPPPLITTPPQPPITVIPPSSPSSGSNSSPC